MVDVTCAICRPILLYDYGGTQQREKKVLFFFENEISNNTGEALHFSLSLSLFYGRMNSFFTISTNQ